MGLFGKLFEKKECAFCGEDIGLLGNRKLEDGNMCKTCAKKLSPWFDDRRHSTVAQIQEQLDYREANKSKVAAFTVTRSYGEDNLVLIDDTAGTFMVASDRNYQDENPDVISLTDVVGANVDVDERRDEIEYRDSKGEMVSYNPPRYRYHYDFYVIVNVRNPYFNDMRFRLNRRTVTVEDHYGADPVSSGIGMVLNALA
ncbi:MAG: DUF4428 domain-containing protein, partial [Eggerthellaceae bacterium]|nr:DUF4428 domain-containing protein [Eggerthellaceae bacterium]